MFYYDFMELLLILFPSGAALFLTGRLLLRQDLQLELADAAFLHIQDGEADIFIFRRVHLPVLRQVAEQTQVNADLSDAVENSGDPDRQADLAREKLGLVEPGEYIFRFTD